jgi:hypothetical protein
MDKATTERHGLEHGAAAAGHGHFDEKSMQTIKNQVPLYIQSVISSMEGVLNVAPLQLQCATSSQRPLMLIGYANAARKQILYPC